MKKSKGFSYIEVILALALFAIAMLAIIPTLSQAGRNIVFAEDVYASHLQAQRIMLTVRDALIIGADPEQAVSQHIADGFEFSVWVFGQIAQEFHTLDVPAADASVVGINMDMANRASTIVVVVWGDDEQVAGRAIGMAY